MKIGDCLRKRIAHGTFTVWRIAEDEYEIAYSKYDSTIYTAHGPLHFLHIITCTSTDDVRILFMDMMWQQFRLQLGFHEVEAMLSERSNV